MLLMARRLRSPRHAPEPASDERSSESGAEKRLRNRRGTGGRFDTEAYPAGQRSEAWQEALNGLTLKSRNFNPDGGFHASAHSVVSPLGIAFAHIASEPQEFVSCGGGRQGMRLTLLLSGSARLDMEGGEVGMTPGVGSLCASYRISFTRTSSNVLDARLMCTVRAGPGYICGVGRIFADLLGSVATSIDVLSPEQMRPVKVAVIEFLAACGAPASALRSATGPAF